MQNKADLPAVLLYELPAVALRLQLVDVDGDGPDAEQLNTAAGEVVTDLVTVVLPPVHGEVALALVEYPHHQVVVVACPLPQPGVEHSNLALAGAVVG